MRYEIEQFGAASWYWSLIDAESGEPVYRSPIRYPSQEAAFAVVLKLRGTNHWTPVRTVAMSPLESETRAI